MVKCNKDQIERLKKALKRENDPVVRQRIQMVLLREDGKTQPQIAELTGVSLSTVNRAHMAYDNGGVNALKPKPSGGRIRENMTLREEKALLAQFAKAAGAGELLNIHDLKAVYEKAIGHYRGEVAPALAAAVPIVAAWTTTPALSKAISPEHAQRAIDNCDLSSGVGLRDRAVLLLLARLGLRAHEIIALQLEDCNRDSGHVRVRSKSGREQLLPMPADVGAAIAAYLQQGRPTSKDRHLFLRSMAPIRGLMPGSDAIGTIVRYALQRAKIDAPHRGSHQFRHALAVRMLQAGASLNEIGEVLRHQSPQTTSIYARVDISALRSLVLPWPGGVR